MAVTSADWEKVHGNATAASDNFMRAVENAAKNPVIL